MAAIRESTTVRVSRETHHRLRSIAEQTGEQMADVLARAIAQEERRLFWQQFHESLDRLRSNPQAWAAYQRESKDLEGTLTDGFEPEEDWTFLAEAQPEEIEFLSPDDHGNGMREGRHAQTR